MIDFKNFKAVKPQITIDWSDPVFLFSYPLDTTFDFQTRNAAHITNSTNSIQIFVKAPKPPTKGVKEQSYTWHFNISFEYVSNTANNLVVNNQLVVELTTPSILGLLKHWVEHHEVKLYNSSTVKFAKINLARGYKHINTISDHTKILILVEDAFKRTLSELVNQKDYESLLKTKGGETNGTN